MHTETAGFLEALLFYLPEEEDGSRPYDEKTVFDFSAEFTDAADKFVYGFVEHLRDNGVSYDLRDGYLGHNIYMSLSGLGCGFWDTFETEYLEDELMDYSGGDRGRFEHLYICENDDGKLDLGILPEFIDEYREELFHIEKQ